jgi:hypothetical protein
MQCILQKVCNYIIQLLTSEPLNVMRYLSVNVILTEHKTIYYMIALRLKNIQKRGPNIKNKPGINALIIAV